MTRSAVAALAAFVPVLVVLTGAAHGACPPAAIVEGAAGDAALVTSRLAERGVRAPSPGCPAVRAHVERAGERLRVRTRDVDGRASDREVDDAEGAAAVVESWARPELVAGLLGPAEPVAPAIEVLVPFHPPSTARPVDAPGTAASRRFDLGARAETGAESGGALALGVAVNACVYLAPVCLGALGRGHTMVAATTSTDELAWQGLDLLLSISLDAHVGPVRLRPGVGLGVGWESARVTSAQWLPDGQIGTLTRGVSGRRMRAAAELRADVPLGDRVALDLGVTFETSPGQSQVDDPYAPTDPTMPPPPDANGDPGMNLPSVVTPAPATWLWIGAGLRWTWP